MIFYTRTRAKLCHPSVRTEVSNNTNTDVIYEENEKKSHLQSKYTSRVHDKIRDWAQIFIHLTSSRSTSKI